MASRQYVALLRGINVGGNNKVVMADLRQAFENAGYDAVRTYINSGNVLFESGADRSELQDGLEAMLERHFGIQLVVVVRSRQQLGNIVAKAPKDFGRQPDLYHSDVVFLRSPLTPRQAMSVVELREGVDQAWEGTGVVYFARLSARRTQSKMNKIMGTPAYRLMTIRSWSTTTKLLDLWENE